MKTRLTTVLFLVFMLTAAMAQAQQCDGFTTDLADFYDVPAVDLLPESGYGAPQPLVRGAVEYTGQVLEIGTSCPGAYGSLAMCDFSSAVIGVPETGTVLLRYGVDYWADVTINPFQLEIELQSGAIENFTATTNSGFVGFCAPAGETIVRVEMVGHDGVALAFYHGDDSTVAAGKMPWGSVKTLFHN